MDTATTGFWKTSTVSHQPSPRAICGIARSAAKIYLLPRRKRALMVTRLTPPRKEKDLATRIREQIQELGSHTHRASSFSGTMPSASTSSRVDSMLPETFGLPA